MNTKHPACFLVLFATHTCVLCMPPTISLACCRPLLATHKRVPSLPPEMHIALFTTLKSVPSASFLKSKRQPVYRVSFDICIYSDPTSSLSQNNPGYFHVVLRRQRGVRDPLLFTSTIVLGCSCLLWQWCLYCFECLKEKCRPAHGFGCLGAPSCQVRHPLTFDLLMLVVAMV